MSLDKFISGKKKNKKRRKSTDITKSPPSNENNTTIRESTENSTINEETSIKISESETNNQNQQEGLYFLNPENDITRLLLNKEFTNFTKDQLIEIMLDLIHNSSNYSGNKNIVASLLEENKSIKEIAVLLKVSYYEALILVKEIESENKET